jgi:hypothetical protein
MLPSSDRFTRAIAAFDAYHQKDPNTEMDNGQVFPKELLYAHRMTSRLARFAPNAVESVKLAARAQHIGRWEIPREKYPMDKKGYLQWRNEEKMHHAKTAEAILSACGYDGETIERVKFLLLKKELYSNPGTQLLEDVVCLVFIEYYLEDFAEKHDDEKVVDILRKTMKKMTPSALKAVGELKIPERIKPLINRAVSIS